MPFFQFTLCTERPKTTCFFQNHSHYQHQANSRRVRSIDYSMIYQSSRVLWKFSKSFIRQINYLFLFIKNLFEHQHDKIILKYLSNLLCDMIWMRITSKKIILSTNIIYVQFINN